MADIAEPSPVLGGILAGGKGSRMGSDKATAMVGHKTMLERVEEAMAAAVGRSVVLGPEREQRTCWPDEVKGGGPLAGIATALGRMTESHLLAVAVDHPFVEADTLVRLVEMRSSLPVVPVDETGMRQVTCAVYPASIAAAARDEAESGGSAQTLLDRVSFEPAPPSVWSAWGEDGRSWYSVDTPRALAEGVSRYLADR